VNVKRLFAVAQSAVGPPTGVAKLRRSTPPPQPMPLIPRGGPTLPEKRGGGGKRVSIILQLCNAGNAAQSAEPPFQGQTDLRPKSLLPSP
jgi:hypothetical protein